MARESFVVSHGSSLPERPYVLPLELPLLTAHGPVTHHAGVLLGAQEAGETAWGDAPALSSHPQHQPAIRAFAADVARCTLAACKAGLDLAHWLIDQHPTLCRPQPRMAIPLQGTTDLRRFADPLHRRDLRSHGLRAVKLKVGLDDVDRLRAVLADAAVQQEGWEVRLDAGGTWAALSPADLQRALVACADLGVRWVEDPVPLHQLPSHGPLPLAVDVLDAPLPAIREAVARGTVQAVVLKPALCGSLLAFLKLAKDLADAGVTVALSSCYEGPTGLRTLAQLAAVCPGDLAPCGLATHLLWPAHWRPRALAIRQGAFEFESLRTAPAPRGTANLPASGDLVAEAALARPHALAVIDAPSGRTWTWQTWDRAVGHVAAHLRAAGVQAGERVVARLPEGPEAAAVGLACFRLGATWVPLPVQATEAEVAALLPRIQPALILTEIDGLADCLAEPSEVPPAPGPSPLDLQQDAALVFTSGSTGRPKGVRLSHSALEAAAFCGNAHLGLTAADRWLSCLPLCHVGGLMVHLRAAAAGACVVLAPAKAEALAAALQVHQATCVSLVPTLLARLLEGKAQPRDLPALRLVLVGGAPLPDDLRRRALTAGWPVRKTWGMTEACAQVATQTGPEPLGRHAVGLPLPGLAVRAPASAGPRRPGALQVRGPTLFSGYLDDDAPLAEGWFDTGDRGWIDGKGVVHVVGRGDALILRGGENVDPTEVEAALCRVPGVLACAAVGLPHAELGQVVGVWLQAPARPGLADDLSAAAGRMSRARQPQAWLITPEPLPATALGKLRRGEIRSRLLRDGGPLST